MILQGEFIALYAWGWALLGSRWARNISDFIAQNLFVYTCILSRPSSLDSRSNVWTENIRGCNGDDGFNFAPKRLAVTLWSMGRSVRHIQIIHRRRSQQQERATGPWISHNFYTSVYSIVAVQGPIDPPVTYFVIVWPCFSPISYSWYYDR